MAALSSQTVTTVGTELTYSAADAAGDQAPVGAGLALLIRNADTVAVTATLTTPGTYRGLEIADAAVTVPAGGDAAVPLGVVFRDPSSGQAEITYSDAANVTVAVIRIT